MEITQQKSGDLLVIRLAGRLDANWCNHVQNALAAAVRAGEHRVHLDMAEVVYVSSAGLRVLLSFYKQHKAINGLFGVVNASEAVRSVLELAGLDMLIAAAPATQTAPAPAGEPVRTHRSPQAGYEIFPTGAAGGTLRLTPVGDPDVLSRGASGIRPVRSRFGENTFALGVGALGATYEECENRFGEFLAVAGVAAFQPADGSSQPDFIVSQGALVPEGHLLLGLTGEGSFPLLARFEATSEARTVGLTELAEAALEISGAPAAAVVAITETAGLIGAALRKSPAFAAAATDRFGFPQIRDWLSFTSERAFRDSTTLISGVVAQPGTALDPLLRPLRTPGSATATLLGHFHAAAFPYRPLRKGRIELSPSVAALFDAQNLNALLHLLSDPREFNGAGESEFFRGALWIAPVNL